MMATPLARRAINVVGPRLALAGARRHKSSHGRGWYQKYRRDPDSFVKHPALEPFDFDAPAKSPRSHAFFEIMVDTEVAGRIEFELLDDLLPRTCENFKLLATGKAESGFTYLGSPFVMRLLKGVCLLGGGVTEIGNRGRPQISSHSAFEERFFEDEGYFVPHAEEGLLSMSSTGLGTNGSTFYIDMQPNPYMDGRCVVFGRVSKGWDVIQHLNETLYTQRQHPVKKVIIADCGLVE